MFLLTLFVALPLSIALRGMIAAHLGDSLFADTLAAGTSYDWWQEFLAQASGLGTTFVPSIIGFGAVLDNLERRCSTTCPMATTIAGATGAWLVLWSFLSGGVLDRYARMRPTRTHRVLRRVRHALLALSPARAPLAPRRTARSSGFVHPWLFDDFYPWATRDMTVERSAFVVRVLCYLFFGTFLVVCNLVFDYARIRTVVEDRHSAIGAFVAGVRFVRRHPATLRLYLINGAGFVLLALVYALVAPGAPSGLAIWIALALGQLYILLRHYVKLLFYASQVAFFQGSLAHAAYTAAPPVVWPESPAAESIGNGSDRQRPEAGDQDGFYGSAGLQTVPHFSMLAGPHPRSLSRGDFAPRSGRRRSIHFRARSRLAPLARSVLTLPLTPVSFQFLLYSQRERHRRLAAAAGDSGGGARASSSG